MTTNICYCLSVCLFIEDQTAMARDGIVLHNISAKGLFQVYNTTMGMRSTYRNGGVKESAEHSAELFYTSIPIKKK